MCRGVIGGKDSGNFMLLLAREERSYSGRVLFFFFKVFIYFGSTGFLLLHGLSLVASNGGYSLVAVLGFLMVGSLIVEYGL